MGVTHFLAVAKKYGKQSVLNCVLLNTLLCFSIKE